jgi:hypothetical protein
MFSTRSVLNLLPGRFHEQHAMQKTFFFLKTESYTYVKREDELYLVAFNFICRNVE